MELIELFYFILFFMKYGSESSMNLITFVAMLCAAIRLNMLAAEVLFQLSITIKMNKWIYEKQKQKNVNNTTKAREKVSGERGR